MKKSGICGPARGCRVAPLVKRCAVALSFPTPSPPAAAAASSIHLQIEASSRWQPCSAPRRTSGCTASTATARRRWSSTTPPATPSASSRARPRVLDAHPSSTPSSTTPRSPALHRHHLLQEAQRQVLHRRPERPAQDVRAPFDAGSALTCWCRLRHPPRHPRVDKTGYTPSPCLPASWRSSSSSPRPSGRRQWRRRRWCYLLSHTIKMYVRWMPRVSQLRYQ